MCKHEVVIHENTGATNESAPYLGSYIAKETVKEPSFALTAAAELSGWGGNAPPAICKPALRAISRTQNSEGTTKYNSKASMTLGNLVAFH